MKEESCNIDNEESLLSKRQKNIQKKLGKRKILYEINRESEVKIYGKVSDNTMMLDYAHYILVFNML